jgi:hypothetical protein
MMWRESVKLAAPRNRARRDSQVRQAVCVAGEDHESKCEGDALVAVWVSTIFALPWFTAWSSHACPYGHTNVVANTLGMVGGSITCITEVCPVFPDRRPEGHWFQGSFQVSTASYQQPLVLKGPCSITCML